LVKSDKNDPFLGLVAIKTLPYCGGVRSSPPYALTLSIFGYSVGRIAS